MNPHLRIKGVTPSIRIREEKGISSRIKETIPSIRIGEKKGISKIISEGNPIGLLLILTHQIITLQELMFTSMRVKSFNPSMRIE